ncbi:hypothetical protein FQN57_004479 [Myotisia sp. PD_48]|nr:hypothetical protein FQN57_004479 [Myotisia sp. PD_48]
MVKIGTGSLRLAASANHHNLANRSIQNFSTRATLSLPTAPAFQESDSLFPTTRKLPRPHKEDYRLKLSSRLPPKPNSRKYPPKANNYRKPPATGPAAPWAPKRFTKTRSRLEPISTPSEAPEARENEYNFKPIYAPSKGPQPAESLTLKPRYGRSTKKSRNITFVRNSPKDSNSQFLPRKKHSLIPKHRMQKFPPETKVHGSPKHNDSLSPSPRSSLIPERRMRKFPPETKVHSSPNHSNSLSPSPESPLVPEHQMQKLRRNKFARLVDEKWSIMLATPTKPAEIPMPSPETLHSRDSPLSESPSIPVASQSTQRSSINRWTDPFISSELLQPPAILFPKQSNKIVPRSPLTLPPPPPSPRFQIELEKMLRRKKGVLNRADRRKLKRWAVPERPESSLTMGEYCIYKDTLMPNAEQLDLAKSYFHSPVRIWSTDTFRTIPTSDLPEVLFIGRSNCGKSSLINSLVKRSVCFTSAEPGRTRHLNAFAIGGTHSNNKKLALVDCPGYGKGSQADWGDEIEKYLSKRKQLRRVFLLIDAKVGIKPTDLRVLELIRQYTVPYQIIVTKADKQLTTGKGDKVLPGLTEPKIKEHAYLMRKVSRKVMPGEAGGHVPLGDIISTSDRIKVNGEGIGVAPLRWAILQAAGLAS